LVPSIRVTEGVCLIEMGFGGGQLGLDNANWRTSAQKKKCNYNVEIDDVV
jgi:hypothetical protein